MKQQLLWLCSSSILLYCAANPVPVPLKEAKPDESLNSPYLVTRDLQGPRSTEEGTPKSSSSSTSGEHSGIESYTSIRKREAATSEEIQIERALISQRISALQIELASLHEKQKKLKLLIDDGERFYEIEEKQFGASAPHVERLDVALGEHRKDFENHKNSIERINEDLDDLWNRY